MSDPLVYDGFSWIYEEQDGPALRDINLRIGAGEAVGVVGANEQGKTTLARTMNGLIPNNYRGRRKGEIRVFGMDPWSTGMEEITRRVGLVFSNPDAQFTSMSVEEELLFGLENCFRDESRIQQRLQWARNRLELAPLMDRPPYELSGGQKQRVAIASVLVMEPDLLVLDEPTSMLDPVAREQIFDLLADLTSFQTLVVIEHNLEPLVRLVDRIVDLKDHTVYRDTSTRDFINCHDYADDRLYPPEVSQFFARRHRQRAEISDDIPYRLEDAVEHSSNRD